MLENKYPLREFETDDIFSVIAIINKIGVDEFKSCIADNSVKDAVIYFTGGRKTEAEAENEVEAKKIHAEKMGVVVPAAMNVVVNFGAVILAHIADAKEEIYSFAADLAGLKKEDVQKMKVRESLPLFYAIFKNENFADFFGDVSEFLK